MRLTLKIDIEVPDEELPKLAILQAEQPVCDVVINRDFLKMPALHAKGRFMGAQVAYGGVEEDPYDAANS